MTKEVPDAGIDGGLSYTDGADYQVACAGHPTDYNDAYVTKMLAKVAMAAGDIVIADDTSGRKATMGAKTGTVITNSGTADHVVLVNVGTTTIRLITTCTSQALVANGSNTVDFPSWKQNVQDPT
jgi:hypothetical protein